MSDLSQESPLWREWAESRHSVQQMREEIDRLRAENARLIGDHAATTAALAEALRMARSYVVTALSHMFAQDSPTRPSGIAAICGDLARIDAALAKAGASPINIDTAIDNARGGK